MSEKPKLSETVLLDLGNYCNELRYSEFDRSGGKQQPSAPSLSELWYWVKLHTKHLIITHSWVPQTMFDTVWVFVHVKDKKEFIRLVPNDCKIIVGDNLKQEGIDQYWGSDPNP